MRKTSKFKLSDFPGGWLVGDFSPSLLKTSQIEVSMKNFVKGESHACHWQRTATEFTLVLSGRVVLAGEDLRPGDVLQIPPGVHGDFRCLEACQLIVIKAPSDPSDKVECEIH